MSITTHNIQPSYKKDPAYRVTTILFSVLITALFILVVWFGRKELRLEIPRTITLYSFSAMETVMEKGLLPAFQDLWFKNHQEQVEFITTFAGSGVITRQIMTRFPAEVAVLSSELDAQRLVSNGILTVAAWQDIQDQPKFCRSPIVLFVRDSSLLSLNAFEKIDFEKTAVIIPDPLTSGEGQMVLLALYGSKIRQGFDHKTALDHVGSVFSQTQSQPSTSQAAVEQFRAGFGDILFNLEAAIGYHKEPLGLKIIYPQKTIMTEPVVVAIQDNIKPQQEEIIRAFVAFLWSDSAQKILTEYGFRTDHTKTQPGFSPATDKDVFTLDSLGRALELNRLVIDPLVAQN